MNYLIYKESTGEILRYGECPPGTAEQQMRPGESVLTGIEADDRTHFVSLDTGEVQERPEMNPVVAGLVLEAEPGTEFEVLSIPIVTGEIDASGEVEFEFAEPGEYVVRLKKFPYRDTEVTINAS